MKSSKTLLLRGYFLFMAICASALTLTSCSDDDDDDNITVSAVISDAFDSLYPNAYNVTWEMEWVSGTTYYVAEFYEGSTEKEAYFTSDGTWAWTEWDILRADLPVAVSTYISTQYPTYTIDDVEYVDTPTGYYYYVELELSGSADIYLKIDASGNVL